MSFIDKNRKWIILSVTLISVPAMVINYVGSKEHNTSDAVVGTAFGGEKVTGSEVRVAATELELLSRPISEGARVPIGAVIFGDVRPNLPMEEMQQRMQLGNGFMMAMGRQPELFAVLKREAARNGIFADRDKVEEILRNSLGLSETGTPEYANLRGSIASLLAVQAFGDVSAQAVKVTRPALQGIVARQYQALNVRVTMFDASDFAAGPTSVPTTQGGGAALYDKFKSAAAGTPAAENPFGFGYVLPDRVRLDYVTLSNGELLRAAESKSPSATPGPNAAYDWDVEAHKYYAQNPKEFETEKQVPNPMPGLTGSPTIAQKTTQKFEEAKASILIKLYGQKANQLRQQVMRKITGTMSADYKAFVEAPDKVSSLGVRYDSFDYLKKLADKVQAETGIRPGVASLGERFYTYADLTKIQELNGAKTDQGVDLPSYVMALAKPLVREGSKPRFDPLGIYEPSPAFADANSNVVVARVAEALVERTPSEVEVGSQLARDNAAVSAQDRAVAAAEAYRGSARKTVSIASLKTEADVPPELALSPFSQRAFVTGCFDLLRGDASAEHPRAVITLPADRKVAVVELQGVTPVVPGVDAAMLELGTLQQSRGVMRSIFFDSFFTPATIAERTKFVSAKGDAHKG